MCSKELLLLACLFLLGGLRLTSTTTTTTFVAAMSIANQDLERYFRSANATQTLASMAEERIVMDIYNYAYLNYTYVHEGRLEKVTFEEEKARYGEGRIFTVYGKVVHMTDVGDKFDDTACTSNLMGTLGEPTPAEGVAWIALVRRGRCTFEEKVRNVHAKGASGVIIYNDKPVMSLEKMQIKGKERNITAVITYLEIGIDMARILDRGTDISAAIIQGRNGSRPVNTLNKTSVLFVSISFMVLMVISVVWLIFYYVQRFRYIQTKDLQSRQLCSVTKKAIMKIPTKTGKSTDEKDVDSDCCAICIEAYKPSDCIRVLPCKHEFHKNCIDPWLIEHRTCPMCKLDVLKFYGFVFLGSEESILEYETERLPASNGAAASTATAATSTTATVASTLHPPDGGALSSLIRSRDFVIDFPRVFVLESGSAVGTRESLFPARLPERSQSSMSLAHAKDWMSVVTNKLDEQHGLRRLRRKSNNRDDMDEQLLDVACSESVKKRRSRSADGRYSHGFVGRRELARLQAIANANANSDAVVISIEGDDVDASTMPPNTAGSGLRRATLRNLTEATYAQSAQRQTEEDLYLTTRRRAIGRDSVIDIPLQEIPNRADSAVAALGRRGSCETMPPIDLAAITIQINGEDLD